MKQLLYIDLFCGASGTSTGVNSARLDDEQCAENMTRSWCEALCAEIERHHKNIV